MPFYALTRTIMSSEISKLKKSGWDKWWINLHQKTSHKTRVRLLADIFSKIIADDPRPTVRCLDVGCGDMTIAELLAKSNTNTEWTCLDIYQLPDELKSLERWQKYRSFDGLNMPFENGAFEFVVLSDVLHHSLDPSRLLAECARVGQKIMVKDHFQYGFFSNLVLEWMDRFGNQAYGVHIPARYFSEASFAALCRENGLRISRQKTGIQLYGHLPILRNLLRPKWQFWAIVEKI